MLSLELPLLIDAALHTRRVSASIELLIGLSAITVIVCMPLRDPDLSRDGISPPFGHPTSQLRSPEDNLSLWQFMTVSWMTPLIALGSARQLNNEDVWSLALEFQHRALHDCFRELKGSVVRRLITANGLDLMTIFSLAVLESLASMQDTHDQIPKHRYLITYLDVCSPVLLQQLLRSMQNSDTDGNAAVTYAVLSLLVRLIASQCSVFNLWFSRRCYERSRGEMITMLYEKTLSRKIIGTPTQPAKVVCPDVMNNGGLSTTTKGLRYQLTSIWEGLFGAVGSLFSKINGRPIESKKPASMGMILNMMRHDTCVAPLFILPLTFRTVTTSTK